MARLDFATRRVRNIAVRLGAGTEGNTMRALSADELLYIKEMILGGLVTGAPRPTWKYLPAPEAVDEGL